jgi:hypothetical protein
MAKLGYGVPLRRGSHAFTKASELREDIECDEFIEFVTRTGCAFVTFGCLEPPDIAVVVEYSIREAVPDYPSEITSIFSLKWTEWDGFIHNALSRLGELNLEDGQWLLMARMG